MNRYDGLWDDLSILQESQYSEMSHAAQKRQNFTIEGLLSATMLTTNNKKNTDVLWPLAKLPKQLRKSGRLHTKYEIQAERS